MSIAAILREGDGRPFRCLPLTGYPPAAPLGSKRIRSLVCFALFLPIAVHPDTMRGRGPVGRSGRVHKPAPEVQEWLLEHIRKSDMKYRPFLTKKGAV